MGAKLNQVVEILADRFCIEPFFGALPRGVTYIGMRFSVPEDVPPDQLWLHTVEPVWGSLSMALANKRCGVSMFQPFWTLHEMEDGRLDLAICTEEDPIKVAEAIILDTPGHRIGRA